MTRLAAIARDELSPEARTVWDGIAGPRGDVRGPYQILMNVPELAHVVGEVSRTLRFTGTLDNAELELVVLVTAVTCGAPFVFDAHLPMAVKAGTRPSAIEVARSGSPPAGLSPREQTLVEVTRSLIRAHRLDDGLFARATAEFGEKKLVELVTLVGYYTLVGMLLGAFDFTEKA